MLVSPHVSGQQTHERKGSGDGGAGGGGAVRKENVRIFLNRRAAGKGSVVVKSTKMSWD